MMRRELKIKRYVNDTATRLKFWVFFKIIAELEQASYSIENQYTGMSEALVSKNSILASINHNLNSKNSPENIWG